MVEGGSISFGLVSVNWNVIHLFSIKDSERIK